MKGDLHFDKKVPLWLKIFIRNFQGNHPLASHVMVFRLQPWDHLLRIQAVARFLDAGNWLHLIIACQRGGNFLWHLLNAFLDWARAHGDATSGDDWTSGGKRFTKQIRWFKGGKLLDVILFSASHPMLHRPSLVVEVHGVERTGFKLLSVRCRMLCGGLQEHRKYVEWFARLDHSCEWLKPCDALAWGRQCGTPVKARVQRPYVDPYILYK